MGTQLENSQKKTSEEKKEAMRRKRCGGNCPGTLEPGYTTQTFERRGSPVKVTIRNIPARVCPLCHAAYISLETGHEIDLLLEPFHGKHGTIPSLPPAEVVIDFAEAAALKAA